MNWKELCVSLERFRADGFQTFVMSFEEFDKIRAVVDCLSHAVSLGYFSEGGSTDNWAKESLKALGVDIDQ